MKLTPNDIEDFYSQYVSFDDATRVTRSDGSVELTTRCPFHKDKKPSLSVNLTKGVYKCHAKSCPQSDGGNIYQFYAAVNNVDVTDARDKIYELYKKNPKKVKDFPITEEQIQAWHNALLSNHTMLSWLRQHCRYTDQTIEDFELGWDGKRVTIPIRRDGQLVNVRQYSPKGKLKMTGVREFNKACLWPLENLEHATVYLFEGEKDCMLANQLGVPSATVTGGAGTFKHEWRKYFVGKNVVICYDIDKAGEEGAQKVATVLTGSALSIRIIQLPITSPSNGDFTDYIAHGYSIQDFHDLINRTHPLVTQDQTYIKIDDEVSDATLEEATYKNNFYKRLRIKIRVLGKDLAPFIIPKRVCFRCTDGNRPKCSGCGLTKHSGLKLDIELNESRPELLALLNCSTVQQRGVLRQIAGIAGQCTMYTIEFEALQFVEEVTAIPYIDENTDSDFIRRTIFILNNKLRDNGDYELETLTVPDPRSQYLVHIGYKAHACETSIEEFKMTSQLYEQLRVFQCPQNESNNNLITSTQTSQPT